MKRGRNFTKKCKSRLNEMILSGKTPEHETKKFLFNSY